MQVVEAGRRASPEPGAPGDSFWQDTNRQLLRYALPILYSAYGTVSIDTLLAFVNAAPTSATAYGGENPATDNFAFETMRRAKDCPKVPLDYADLERIVRYWITEYTTIPERTRGNAIISLSATLDRFRHGRLRQAFCGKTTILPEMVTLGAVIILAMPALSWGMDGILGQQVFKLYFQQAMDARNSMAAGYRERPVVLWADECQYFCHSRDKQFLSTARSSRTSVVYITQSISNIYAGMGKNEEASTEAIIGLFSNIVMHQNADTRTNEWASKLIGRSLQRRQNFSYGEGINSNAGMNTGSNTSWGSSSSSGGSSGGGGSSNWSLGSTRGGGENYGDNRGRGRSENSSHGFSETMDNIIEPAFFSHGLKSGGPENRGVVTALWFKNGGHFQASGGAPYLHVTFQQGRL